MSRPLLVALTAGAMLLIAAPSFSQDKSVPVDPAVKRYQEAKKKKAQRIKPVDINSASKAELKKLPGLSEADADKIIAGRPYRSKADLATRKILPTGIYLQIKGRIIAQQVPEAAATAPRK